MDREEFTTTSLLDHLNVNYVSLNWDQPSQFESALSSIVSSPSNQTPQSDNVVIRELIGRLGTICNSSGEIEMSPHSQGYNNSSVNASSYTTPLNSPPKLGLSMSENHYQSLGSISISGNPLPIPATGTARLSGIVADPGFAERAARFSCFGGRNYNGFPGVYPTPPEASPQLLQINEHISPKGGCGSQPNDRDEPSVSDHIPVISRSNARKRKSISKTKPNETSKVLSGDDSHAKNSRSDKSKLEQACSVLENGDGSQERSKESNSKTPEIPRQDYIHVRARRGQATDSHSLAERVRREKISERMKFLQNLVPGCKKVTGKAVMLDEIINYVQSLQRQVEFLSMKLSTVNHRLDLNVENLISKDIPHSGVPMDLSGPVFPFSQNVMMNGVQSLSHCNLNPLDAASLFGTLWEDDLQSVVQMGFEQNQETAFSSQLFPGALPSTHMKVEL